jgi:4,5-DOPA dioxygenase extradiol
LDFHKFLIDSLTEKESNYEKRKNRFIDWKNQSNGSGIMCHPREEHFIPLLVCIGAAKENRAHIK